MCIFYFYFVYEYEIYTKTTVSSVKSPLTLPLPFSQYEAIRGILVYEYTLAQCLTFRVIFDYTWIIRVFPAPPGGPK